MSSSSSRLPNPSPSPALRPNKRLRTDSSSSHNGSASQIEPHLLQHHQFQTHPSSSTSAHPAQKEKDKPRAPSNSFRHPSIISTAYERDQSVFYPEDEGDSQVGLDLEGEEEEEEDEGSVAGTVTGKVGKGVNGKKGKGGIR